MAIAKPEKHFRGLVKEIADLAFSHGIQKVGSFDPRGASHKETAKFIEACHQGYALAQEKLVGCLSQLETGSAKLKELQKEARRRRFSGAAAEVTNFLDAFDYQQMALRTIANGIAWTLLGRKRWVVRRFWLNQKPTPLSSSNMSFALEVAREVNKDPTKFALITDLTSCIQLGDLLIVDWDAGRTAVQIIELKQGDKNHKILEFLDFFGRVQCERALWFFAKEEGPKAVQQAGRIIRQQMRASQAIELLQKDEGTDPATGQHLVILDPVMEEDKYDDGLMELIERARIDGERVGIVDDCLWVGVYDSKRRRYPRLLFEHHLCHQLLGTKECFLPDYPDDVTEELLSASKVPYPISSLQESLITPLATPIFLRALAPDGILDIVSGELAVFLYLDWDGFFRKAEERGIKAGWQKPKQGELVKGEGYFRAIGKVPVFELQGEKTILGGGVLVKMIFDGVRPDSILEQLNAILMKPSLTNHGSGLETP